MATKRHSKPKGLELWLKYLLPEKNFFIVSFTYACAISLLSLAIPISVQALVNTVTFAVLMQPLVVVSILLLILLILSGFLNGLQDYAVEYFQRHFYVRSTMNMAKRLLCAQTGSLSDVYAGDLVNRYFDIMTVQKSGAKLMVGGFSLVLQTFVGMILLAFYHPYFLAFDIILIFLLSMVWILYGKKSIDSAIVESKAKYKVGAWLEQMANSNKFFKTNSRKEAAEKRTHDLIENYLNKRSYHFSFLFRQIIFLLGIYALMSALILGLGGFLVIEGQLTLGQLVAAEIVVAVILSSFAKAGDYLESVYDLHAGLDKVADFEGIFEEKDQGALILDMTHKNLHFDEVSLNVHGYSYSFNALFEEGKAYVINEDFDSTQRVFLELIHGDIQPDRGKVIFGQYDCQTVTPATLREHVYVVDEPTLMEGTVSENIIWGINDVSMAALNEALDEVGLTSVLSTLPKGKDTLLWPGSNSLFWGESIRLEMARVLLKKPSWVVISSLFHQLPYETQGHLLDMFKKRGIGVLVWSTGYAETPKGFDGDIQFSRMRILGGES